MRNYPLEQAKVDLSAFAKAGKNDIGQSMFRSSFFNVREHVLGKRASMSMTFDECVAWAVDGVRDYVPGFTPRRVS